MDAAIQHAEEPPAAAPQEDRAAALEILSGVQDDNLPISRRPHRARPAISYFPSSSSLQLVVQSGPTRAEPALISLRLARRDRGRITSQAFVPGSNASNALVAVAPRAVPIRRKRAVTIRRKRRTRVAPLGRRRVPAKRTPIPKPRTLQEPWADPAQDTQAFRESRAVKIFNAGEQSPTPPPLITVRSCVALAICF